jgi:phosphatidylglycerophosphate synthase
MRYYIERDQGLRDFKERLLAPLIASYCPRVHPTAFTMIAGMTGVAASLAAASRCFHLALGLWLFSRVFDMFDGTIARVRHLQSDLGAYLDLVLDVLVFAAIPIGISVGFDQVFWYRASAILLGCFFVDGAAWMYLTILLERLHTKNQSQNQATVLFCPAGGAIEGPEIFVFYTAFLFFPEYAPPLMLLMGVLILFTALQRVIWALRNPRLRSTEHDTNLKT